ncbi:unnamed protein product [Coregonus sp. 'balchen']|nr:unnamed protein product [Coregonus sp. 'balchen']
MVPNSLDDMYNGCTEQMYNKVQKEYLEHENNREGIFKQAWMNAEKCARKAKSNSKDKLTHDHIKAICAYTAGSPKIYPVFNQAVRTNRTEYTTSFQFHSLHFLLTDAICLLKLNQQTCHTTYRRTNMEFGDMVPNSLDDMYNGCTEQMYNKVQKEYLEHENNREGIFKQAWMNAEKCARKAKSNSKDKLTHDHIKAICAYTAGSPKIYPVFNQAVRTNRTEYTTSFQFHSLHFLLTDAICLLKLNQQTCHTTYRRTNMEFGGEVNKIIRFGFFASSSLEKGI